MAFGDSGEGQSGGMTNCMVNQATVLDSTAGSYEVLVSVGGISDHVHFRSETPLGNDDALLPMALEPSMRVGGVLDLPRGLSPSIRSSCPKIQDLLADWSGRSGVPQFEHVEVRTSDRPSEPAKGRGVGAFFTSGLDSTYTALKHSDEITHLIYVDRFDLPHASSAVREAALMSVRSSAANLNKQLIEVETNLRDFSDRWVSWTFYHGAALATVALLLSQQLYKVYIPSSLALWQIGPWGSHPSLDPLWGTDSMAIVHDGSEADRIQKIRAIAEHPGALSHLRVCWENAGDTEESQNCGTCEKCLRTMLSLWRCGLLERATSFPDHIDPWAVVRARLPRPDIDIRSQWHDAFVYAIKVREPALSCVLALVLVRASLAQRFGDTKWNLWRLGATRRLAEWRRGRRSRLDGPNPRALSSRAVRPHGQNEDARTQREVTAD